MRPPAWAPEPQEHAGKPGACGRSCCWRGPHGACEPVRPDECRCHGELVSKTRRKPAAVVVGAQQLEEQSA